MNIEHRILNIEVSLNSTSSLFRLLCVGTKKTMLFPLIIFFISSVLSAQPLQTIYSNLDNATSLYVTPNSIYIVEQGKNRLLKLDHSGKLLESIGGQGSGNYQFSKPVDVDATNGLKIFITDYNNRRVQVFDRRGQYLSSIEARGSFGTTQRFNPTQIAVSRMGEVYFVDETARYIRHFDLDYNLLDEFRLPSQIESVDELEVTSTEIIILDTASQTIHRLALNGSYRGFYPAENSSSIFASDTGLWKATQNQLMFEPKAGESAFIEFSQSLISVDLFVIDETTYILTAGELLKLKIPGR